ncbi:MAG TPA: hypothetical protein V6D50_15270, partial [Chroococcales cyanobacterium]
MTTIKISASVVTDPGAPAVNLATAIPVEAYTKIEFVLTDKTEPKKLNLGKLGTDILFILIKADLNDSDAAVKPKLTYTAGKEFSLEAPHLYLGQGFTKALGDAGIDFANLTFTFTPLTPEEIKTANDNKQTIA